MTRLATLFSILCFAVSSGHAELNYTFNDSWLQLPEGQEYLGNSHGEIEVDAAGNVYTFIVENGQGRWVRGRVGSGGIERTILAERYIPSIWVDPDGCQHWYIDDGLEGFMTPRLNRDGTPKCQDTRGEIILKDGSTVASEVEPSNT